MKGISKSGRNPPPRPAASRPGPQNCPLLLADFGVQPIQELF
jgi:hypothetical protein